jgi:hypothetical protein
MNRLINGPYGVYSSVVYVLFHRHSGLIPLLTNLGVTHPIITTSDLSPMTTTRLGSKSKDRPVIILCSTSIVITTEILAKTARVRMGLASRRDLVQAISFVVHVSGTMWTMVWTFGMFSFGCMRKVGVSLCLAQGVLISRHHRELLLMGQRLQPVRLRFTYIASELKTYSTAGASPTLPEMAMVTS